MPLIELSCGHVQSTLTSYKDIEETLPRRKDGWYSARRCVRCKRVRAVVQLEFGRQYLARDEKNLTV